MDSENEFSDTKPKKQNVKTEAHTVNRAVKEAMQRLYKIHYFYNNDQRIKKYSRHTHSRGAIMVALHKRNL